MVYRQNSDYLRYGEYPFSSYVYTYDPNNDVLKKEVEARGYYRFCRPHNHTAIEVIRILDGSVEIMLGGESFCATEGDIVFFNPFDIHSITASNKDLRVEIQVINFDISLMKNEANKSYVLLLSELESGIVGLQPRISKVFSCQSEISWVLERMGKDFDTAPEVTSFMKIISGLYRLFILLSENNMITEAKKGKTGRGAQNNFSRKVVKYVAENYDKPISTKDAALWLHQDKSYFCRNFRAVFGERFIDYLHEYRISVAKSLRLDDDLNLSNIAEKVGYANYDVFAASFKKYTGITPKSYFVKSIIPNS